jgi:hypothetical protein
VTGTFINVQKITIPALQSEVIQLFSEVFTEIKHSNETGRKYTLFLLFR